MSTGPYLQSWQLATVTFSLCLGTFLVALDINIIGVAVPEITSVFNSLNDASWYATAYLLTITAFQPIMGFLYKSFPVRAIYFSNVVIFEVGAVLCAAAPSSPVFILGRAISGLGAAGLLQGALAIVGHIVELKKRPLFLSIVISVFGVSVCVGPVMGGAFVESIGWRWCFWINLPIGGAAMLILALFLRMNVPNNEHRNMPLREKIKRMDTVGAILFLGAICCLTLATQWGGQVKLWSSPDVIGTLVGFGALTALFAVVQYRKKGDALIPLNILRQRSILTGCIFLFLTGMFNYEFSFYLPFYFQSAQLVTPLTSGVRMIPFVLAQIIAVGVAGAAMTHWGYYVPYMAVGMAICSLGAGLVTRFGSNTRTVEWAASLVVAGIGLGTAQQVPYTGAQVVLSEADLPTGNALFVFFNQLGGIVAIAAGQNLFLSELRRQVVTRVPSLNPSVVVAAGATSLRELAGASDTTLIALQQAYSESLRRPFILGLSAACAAVLCTIGMEKKNIKTEAAERENTLEAEEMADAGPSHLQTEDVIVHKSS